MSQHDYVIANGTGAAVRSDLNGALAAIVTQNSGATAPSTTYAYQWWADTTTGLLKLRNAANNAWITLFQLDGEWSTLAVENGSAAAPSIYFKDSGTDTGIYSPGTDQVAISTGGTGRLFVDSSGRVGLGTSSPGTILQVNGSGSETVSPQTPVSFYATTSGTAANGFGVTLELGAEASDGSNYAQTTISSIWTDATAATRSSALTFSTRSNAGAITERLRISPTGAVGIGTTGPVSALDVGGSTSGQTITFSNTADNTGSRLAGALSYRTGSAYTGKILEAHIAGAFDNISDLRFFTANAGASSERARIDSSGRLLVGTSTARTVFTNYTPNIQIEGTTNSGSTASVINNSNIASGPHLFFGKSRGTALGSSTVVQVSDELGVIAFNGADGSDIESIGALIKAEVDGTPGANDMPGRLVFSTTADGASSPTTRYTIASNGDHRFSNTADVHPVPDNAVRLGFSGGRWSAVWAVNGTIQTSDERAKTDISDAQLGSEFIKSLRPVSYKWLEGGKVDSGERDEDGNYIYESVPGERTHWGFIAQEVKEAVDDAGVDFGGWVLTDKDDPDSQQALRYDQFIAPLTKALQEALAKIETLEAKVAALESA